MAEVLIRERVLLDLTVEDQDHTYSLLETGLAVGCISTEPKPMLGCTASPLGSMRYRLVASAEFRQKHFANGLSRNAARKAPVVAYTRKITNAGRRASREACSLKSLGTIKSVRAPATHC